MGGTRIDLSLSIEQANHNGEGLWDLAVEFDNDDGFTRIWLIDYNEFLTSENFMEDWIWKGAIQPIESAIKEQTGDIDFYFDAYDYAGRFVGSLDGLYEEDDGWERYEYNVIDETGELNGAVLVVSDSNDGWGAKMFIDNQPTTYSTSSFYSKEEAIEAFHRHRPQLAIEEIWE